MLPKLFYGTFLSGGRSSSCIGVSHHVDVSATCVSHCWQMARPPHLGRRWLFQNALSAKQPNTEHRLAGYPSLSLLWHGHAADIIEGR